MNTTQIIIVALAIIFVLILLLALRLRSLETADCKPLMDIAKRVTTLSETVQDTRKSVRLLQTKSDMANQEMNCVKDDIEELRESIAEFGYKLEKTLAAKKQSSSKKSKKKAESSTETEGL